MGRVVTREMGAGLALLALAAQPALGQPAPTLAASGFSGLAVTPTAPLLRWGTMALAYDDGVVGAPKGTGRFGTEGHNLVAGFGLLPHLEVSGRIAASTTQRNCYTEPCGVRDLSFNFKTGMALDDAGHWNVALGATDIGGAATFFRSAYGVLGYSTGELRFGALDLSAGYAHRDTSNAGRTATPLDGAFASMAYRPWSWLQGSVEHVDGSTWAAARVFAPTGWLPEGWAAHVGANFRVQGDARTPREWFGLGLTVPLYKVSPTSPRPVASAAAGAAPVAEFPPAGLPLSAPLDAGLFAAPAPSVAASAPVAPAAPAVASPAPAAAPPVPVLRAASAPTAASDERLAALADALVAKGFEDVSVGRLANGTVAVQFNNATYNVNTADGLGVALGVLARHLADANVDYRLVLTQRQLAIVAAEGRSDCLAQWVAQQVPACDAVRLSTPGQGAIGSSLDGAAWVVRDRAPSWATARLVLQPVLRTALATEYGVLDYSAGIRATVQQPLWQGAYAEVSHVAPLAESEDYRDGGVFASSRLRDATDRVLVHQLARLPIERLLGAQSAGWGAGALTAHVAAGRFDSNYRGAYGELRWEPGAGSSRFGLEAGRFDRSTAYDRDLPLDARMLLGSYRYAYQPTRTAFEATAGQFMYNDRGVRLGIRQWFDDVSVSLFVRRTKFDWATEARNFAGIEISIPLTPRKDMSPTHHVQVTGAPRWSYGVETVVGGNSNYITTGQGVTGNGAVLDRTFNSDRASLEYFQGELARIRSAAAR